MPLRQQAACTQARQLRQLPMEFLGPQRRELCEPITHRLGGGVVVRPLDHLFGTRRQRVARLAVRIARSRTRQDQIRQHAAVHEDLIERREELANTLADLLFEALEHRQAHIRRQRQRFQRDGPGASDLLRLEHPHGARRRDRLIAMPQMGELGVALAGDALTEARNGETPIQNLVFDEAQSVRRQHAAIGRGQAQCLITKGYEQLALEPLDQCPPPRLERLCSLVETLSQCVRGSPHRLRLEVPAEGLEGLHERFPQDAARCPFETAKQGADAPRIEHWRFDSQACHLHVPAERLGPGAAYLFWRLGR